MIEQDEQRETISVLAGIIDAKRHTNPYWAANEALQAIAPDELPGLIRLASLESLQNFARALLRDAFVAPDAAHPLFVEIQFGHLVESGERVLPENMTDADRNFVTAELRRESEALFTEADALERYGASKGFVRRPAASTKKKVSRDECEPG